MPPKKRGAAASGRTATSTASQKRQQQRKQRIRPVYTPRDGDAKRDVGTRLWGDLVDQVDGMATHARQFGFPPGIRTKEDVLNFCVWFGMEYLHQQWGGPYPPPRTMATGRARRRC